MPKPLFQGVITALVTPFRDGVVDEPAFKALVEHQVSEGVHGVVPVGTTPCGSWNCASRPSPVAYL
jgi:4-hydroxy-tetrahydrodipicolinate synthase